VVDDFHSKRPSNAATDAGIKRVQTAAGQNINIMGIYMFNSRSN
jgi:hypothetical protein